jgi:hypothetical protein
VFTAFVCAVLAALPAKVSAVLMAFDWAAFAAFVAKVSAVEMPVERSVWKATTVSSTAKVRLPLVPPPVSPDPEAVVIPVIVPVPGKLCPETKLIWPVLAIDRPVSPGVPLPDRYSKFSVPEGLAVLLPAGSASQENSCGTAVLVPLLNEEAIKSMGLEVKPCVAVAVPVAGSAAPAAVRAPLNVAVVPLSAPVSVPPARGRKVLLA